MTLKCIYFRDRLVAVGILIEALDTEVCCNSTEREDNRLIVINLSRYTCQCPRVWINSRDAVDNNLDIRMMRKNFRKRHPGFKMTMASRGTIERRIILKMRHFCNKGDVSIGMSSQLERGLDTAKPTTDNRYIHLATFFVFICYRFVYIIIVKGYF